MKQLNHFMHLISFDTLFDISFQGVSKEISGIKLVNVSIIK